MYIIIKINFILKSFDLRDPNFLAECVSQEDVYHAKGREIDNILKVSGTALHRTISSQKPTIKTSVLIKCQNIGERQKDSLLNI